VDLRRLRSWDWLTGLAGLVLLVSLFLPWYSVGGHDVTAWQAFAAVDVILAAAGVAALALVVVAAWQRTAAVPQALASMMIWLSAVAAVVVLVRLLNVPGDGSADVGREVGVWLGTLAALTLLAFNAKAIRDKRFPGVMRPSLDIETIPAPAPDGSRRDVQ
jgi:hypothetical protein